MSDQPQTSIRDDVVAAVAAVDQKDVAEWDSAIQKTAQTQEPAGSSLPAPQDGGGARKDELAGGSNVESVPPAEVKKLHTESTAAASSPAQQSPERIDPPVGWKGAGKVDWNRLPKSVQGELAEDYRRIAAAEQSYGQIAKIIEPRLNHIVGEFGSPAAFVERMLQLSDFAGRDPVAFITWYANNRGIDLGQLISARQSPGPQQAPLDPATAALNQRLQQLERMQLESLRQQQNQALESDTRKVSEFFANPKFTYAQDLRLTMADLIDSKQASTLEEAYEKAMWLHPQLRENLVNQRLESQAAEKKKAAERARAAGGSIVGAPINGHAGAPGSGSVRDSIIASMSEVEGRA